MEANDYYKHNSVLFELVKQFRGKEISFLGEKNPVRCIKAHNVEYLRNNFNAFNFHKKVYNIYHSLAHLKYMPMFSYNPMARRKQQVIFNKEFPKYVIDYDFGMDFDCTDDFNIVYEETSRILDELNAYKVPFNLKLSGSGFHVVIPYIMTALSIRVGEIESVLGGVAKSLKNIFNLTTLDTKIYTLRRIWKSAYSLDYKTGNVALPLDDKQFKDFSFKMVQPENAIKTIKQRGLLTRPGKTENIIKFIDDYELRGNNGKKT